MTGINLDQTKGLIPIRQMAAFGASCPLPSVWAKIGLLTRLPTFDLGGGNRSRCPKRVIHDLTS
jgi:hypothetical protein